jgi:hypothetical protein
MKTPKSRTSLERRRRKIALALPSPENMLRGSVFVRRRRCGRAACWCAKVKGHATGYISATFADGSTEQISLPAQLVPEARRWVAVYRRWWRDVERISAINRELFRNRWIEPRSAKRRA